MKKELERKIVILRKVTDLGYYHEAHFVRVKYSVGKDDCYVRDNVTWSNGSVTHKSYTAFTSNEEGNRVYTDFRKFGYEVVSRYTLDSKALADLQYLATN